MTYLFGGTSVTLFGGQLAVFWAAIPHQVVYVEEKSVLHWVTIPFLSFLQWQLPTSFMQQTVCGKFVVSRGENEKLLYQNLINQWNSDLQQGSEEQRRIVMLELEACLRRIALSFTSDNAVAHDIQSIFTKGNLQHVERMASFIAEHYTESLSVERIAQEVHLNPNYAMSLFRKSVGTSIVDYTTQYRIAHAQRLLVTTHATIAQIALDAGFGSVSRFYVAFKAICGVLPGEYRVSLSKKTETLRPSL